MSLNNNIKEILESKCIIEVDIHFDEKRDVIIKYFIVADKESPRMDKQKTRNHPVSRIKYRNISVNVICSSTVPFKKLS